MKINIGLFLLIISLQGFAKENTIENDAFKLSYQSISLQQWPDIVSSYKGRVLIVDMWATWCSSCLKRFPQMVSMNNYYKDKGVVFISLLLEDPEEPEAIENAKKFLIKQQADFNHYFMNENIMTSFEKLDLLGIPTVFVYSQDGKLAYRLTGDNPNKQFTEKDVEKAINKLLSKVK